MSLSQTSPKPYLAWTAIALTVAIWGGYMILARALAREALGPVDLGLLRFAPAALLFAPVWLRFGLKPRRIRWIDALAVGVLGGFTMVSFLTLGLTYAPVADGGIFAPSMLPFFVALLSFVLLGERFSRVRLIGLALILIGALAVGGWEAVARSGSGTWRGHILLLCAAFAWAVYSVVFRRSGMTAIEAAAIIALYATIGFGVWAVLFGTGLDDRSWRFIAIQIVVQGVLTGFVAAYTYGFAMTRLGPSQSAAFAALVPVITALGGLVLLDEPIGSVKGLGIAVTACGVLLASGAIGTRQDVKPPAPA
ncbi:MAG: DMT family transporter [Pseudomonadota bacterium]